MLFTRTGTLRRFVATVTVPTFVGAKDTTSGTTGTITVSYPTGMQAGDFLVVIQDNDLTSGFSPSTLTGWTHNASNTASPSGYFLNVWSRAVTSADISAGGASFVNNRGGNGHAVAMVYRNATALGQIGFTSGATTSISTSYAPSANTKGAIGISFDRNLNASNPAPTNFTLRANYVQGSSNYTVMASDRLLGSAAGAYPGGTVTFSLSGAVWYFDAYLLELL